MALYLITGAAGFIGSALAHELVERGEDVRGIDNLITGDRNNLAGLRGKIDFREADLLDPVALASACKGVDFVLHQAALASVPRSIADPLATTLNNVTGTLDLLLAARDAGVKRVVYAGSSSAYGNTPTLPKREEMTPDPISPYAVSKLAAEHYMTCFHQVYGLETVTLRYFNVFGPRQNANSQYSAVLAKFISQMLRGERPTIFGDGEQSRDFTYVLNVVEANLSACRGPAERVAGKTFNIATGKRHTLNQVYRMLREILDFHDEPVYAPERAGDVKHSLADISRAQADLGYFPKVDFPAGLRHTVDWYRARNSQTASANLTR